MDSTSCAMGDFLSDGIDVTRPLRTSSRGSSQGDYREVRQEPWGNRGRIRASVITEGETAMEALVVVQHLVVDHFTQLGASDTTRGCTDQAAQDGPGEAAQGNADRASNYADGAANFCAANGSGDTADGTPGTAHQTAHVTGDVARDDLG
ncbi:protein of unknown function [Denitratisoma oestradiolicum]|uniref:Uncharacterized protein n=1 Tax=Denitratisoma oestradiolicum TaxID=311182 RepID=A0A6S6XXD7_9PROT|nr:protein of unknown function [Denitratisoma oestradiolicum]